jgi:hypothetical protein
MTAGSTEIKLTDAEISERMSGGCEAYPNAQPADLLAAAPPGASTRGTGESVADYPSSSEAATTST